jgi:hypothetical protein
MPPDLQQLVRDTIELTGAAPPRVLEADAPTLAIDRDDAGDVYFVGLIGGKEVGKSAMVNALAGQAIAAVTSHGAGTDAVMAYVHASREPAVRQLLEREAPGQHRIVTHELAGDPNRVLLDLPDIDSHFQAHLILTRRMLRHMLFPIWLVSIEKYADQQPRQMLSRVAEGNDPRNFVFVLNKADQLRGDVAAAAEIRDDYARRVAAVTGIEPPPRVYVVSAREPSLFDLPELRKTLVRSRSRAEVAQAGELAGRRRDRSIVSWMATQNLPERAQRLARLRSETEDLLTARVVGPLLETVLPRLANDAIYRTALVDEAMNVRIARWPLVNLVHALLSPLLAASLTLVRGGGGRLGGTPAQGWIDAYLSIDGRPLHAVLQATFAHARQTSPMVVDLFTTRRPWEDRDAELAVMELRSGLVDTVERQRAHLVARYGRSRNPISALVRWTLTVGALLWFPFLQPLLEAALQPGFGRTTQELGLLVVRILGTSYLLTTVSFLVLYFVILWLALRWRTGRRVARFLTAWGSGRGPDELDFARQAVTWGQALVRPLREAQEKTQRVVGEIEQASAMIQR